MSSITIGDKDYTLRADINALSVLQERYGDISNIGKHISDIENIKIIAAELINEHEYYIKSSVQISPDRIGAQIMPSQLPSLRTAVMSAIIEGMGDSKNA